LEKVRTIETIEVQIASVRVALEVHAPVAARLRRRYAQFALPHSEAGAPARLRLTMLFDDDLGEAAEMAALPNVRLDMLDEDRARLSGDCSASLDLASGCGVLEAGDAFLGMDALVRLSLSLLAPADGWILFHGAAVELVSGGWALLLGSSGAGKSTAARAFVSYCDELVLARPDGPDAEAASTPYWNGRPGRAPCRAVVCLERSETPCSRFIDGQQAFRALSQHVVRHASRDAVDRIVLGQLCALSMQVPVLLVRSQTGDGYPTSLGRALEAYGFALRPNAVQPLGGDRP
jgi:hypothetical protein